MDFIEYSSTWAKSEVTQGRLMIGLGVLLMFVLYSIFRSQNELLKGALIPLSLLLVILIGYGGYILQSRPAHSKESIELYTKSSEEAIKAEAVKHSSDNAAGKTLLRYVYPILMLLTVLVLLIVSSTYYKGMALGFILLFVSTYIIDNGFVTRSDAFLTFLESQRRG